jgi:hypothetical protein
MDWCGGARGLGGLSESAADWLASPGTQHSET